MKKNKVNELVKSTVMILGMAFLPLVLVAARAAQADEQNLQLGYVFDDWTSNSLYHGAEQRIPLSYSFAAADFGFRLSTAFISGDYHQDGNAAYGVSAFEFSSTQFSDSTLGMNLNLDMGNSVKSSFIGSLNIPTGDTTWEAKEQLGSIPYIFEPSYYHGRNWGGNFFYTMEMASHGSQLGLGLGYMATSTYDTGISDIGTYYPGDTVAAIGTIGFEMSSSETWAFRLIKTFPLESKNGDVSQYFTAGQTSIFTSQWTSKMGKDKLVLNFSYSFYNKGFGSDPGQPDHQIENPGDYFGDRMELHPILGYVVGKDLSMETGLIWDRILANGYPVVTDPNHQGGGDLLGVEQSVTLQLNSSTFWNFAGLYHFIANSNEGITGAEIDYQRFSIGTNVGLKW